MSFASSSHAASAPSQPPYWLGSTRLSPMWIDTPRPRCPKALHLAAARGQRGPRLGAGDAVDAEAPPRPGTPQGGFGLRAEAPVGAAGVESRGTELLLQAHDVGALRSRVQNGFACHGSLLVFANLHDRGWRVCPTKGHRRNLSGKTLGRRGSAYLGRSAGWGRRSAGRRPTPAVHRRAPRAARAASIASPMVAPGAPVGGQEPAVEHAGELDGSGVVDRPTVPT